MKNPTPQQVTELRESVQTSRKIGITAAQDACAERTRGPEVLAAVGARRPQDAPGFLGASADKTGLPGKID